MKKLVLSIIIPIFNTPKEEFEKCINSTLTLINDLPTEIIVIDDGSSDELSAEYMKLCNKIKEIKYKKTNNLGVSWARNRGIYLSKGEYLLFLDSDDELITKNIDYKLLSKGYDIICYNMIIKKRNAFVEKKELSFESSKELNKKQVLEDSVKHESFRSLASKFYQSSIIKKNNIVFNTDVIHGEDAIFNLEFLRKTNKIFFKKNVAYKYNFETSHYDKRWEKEPIKLMKNFKMRYDLTIELINDLNMNDELNKYLYSEAIKETFRMLLINNASKKIPPHEIKEFLKGLKIDKKSISFSNRIKYSIIQNNNKLVIWLLSVIRKIYLRIK